ncbi:hypothetical protein [Micromonospora fluostatini]|uniref:hypothetical protein n=1 Tax=Micromonospora sp. JCM 30529 TaxID=3421643 RepID=UPI003D16BF37
MGHGLDAAGPLSNRARAFLNAYARWVTVDPGPGDEECRAAMTAALGYCDEDALTALRRIQHRYSGLTYRSPLRASEIVVEPVFDVDPDERLIRFDHAVSDTAPDGCRYGLLHPDGTLWFGFLETHVPAFPSLEHFLECDALLHHAHRQDLRSTEAPTDATAHRELLLGSHPKLRRLDTASGSCVEWWTDDEHLVFYDGLAGRLAADGRGASRAPTTVLTWRLDAPVTSAA